MKITMILLAIIAYLGFVIYIGVRCSKRNRNTDDFYLGGRQLGPFVTAMSAEASDMSSYLLMGIPGLALLTGLGTATGFAETFWTIVGLAIGTYLNWLIVAKRIRLYSEKTGSSTIPNFFSDRFGDQNGILCLIAAVIIIVFFVPYTGSGFASIGKLFNSLFGVDYHVALIVGGAVVAAYTVIGGFLAASTTDFIQSIIMTFALVVVVCFGLENAATPGFVSIADSLSSSASGNWFSLTGTDGSFGFLQIVSTLAWGLGYFGMPHILLRFMAIKKVRQLRLSRRIASVWVVISMAVATMIGVIGYTYALNNNLLADPAFDAERILIYMADGIANLDTFAAIVAGLIIAGILASTMSTADSQMLAAASSVSENIVHRFVWKKIPEKAQMWVARVTVLLVSAVAIVLAWNPESSVFRIVSFAWAGFGAAFGAVVLFALFWRRTNKWGALAGMIGGAATVFVWKFLLAPLGGVFAIYELLPAFLVSALLVVVVSILTPAPDGKVTATFDDVRAAAKAKPEPAGSAGKEN